MLDNIMAFFGLIGGALFAIALPGLIAGVERFINWAKGVFEAIKSFMNKIEYRKMFRGTELLMVKYKNKGALNGN